MRELVHCPNVFIRMVLRHLRPLTVYFCLACSHVTAQQVRLVNVIPNGMSGENGRDSEPSIAVNPHNPLQIAISAFTRDPGASADAPLFLSTDGGGTWTLSTAVITGANPSHCVATVCDVSLRFADSSDFLYVSALAEPDVGAVSTYRIQRIGSLFGTLASDLLQSETSTDPDIRDQPYIESHTAPRGSGTAQDHIIVPYNDLTASAGQTASVDHSVNAVPPPPAGISDNVVEARATTGQDSPSVRAAANLDGTVYVAFTGRRSGGNEIVVVKDTQWGTAATPFQALLDGTTPGIRVATGLTQSLTKLGTQRVTSPLSIAVHPTDSNILYVAFAEGSTAATYTMHVRNSTDGGSNWSGDLFTVASATNPSLAVNNVGEAGLLYQKLAGSDTSPRFESHFVLSPDGRFSAASNKDILLANVPTDAGPLYSGENPIGDYTGLMAVGKTFYGVFSANNTPDTANFHSSLVYPRNHSFMTHTLTDLMGAAVDISVDPFFFSVTPPCLDTCNLGEKQCVSRAHSDLDRLACIRSKENCVKGCSASLTVKEILTPANNPGRFNLQIDGVTRATNVGNGGSTGSVSVLEGTHTVAESGNGTSLSSYVRTFGGDCDPSGSVTLFAGDNKHCTITNVSRAYQPCLDTCSVAEGKCMSRAHSVEDRKDCIKDRRDCIQGCSAR